MADKESGVGFGIGFPLLFALLGYFVYGQTVAGALGMMLLCFILEASIGIAVIPFAGFIIQILVNLTFIIPNILGLTGLADSWLVTLLFIISTAMAVMVTIIVTLMVMDT